MTTTRAIALATALALAGAGALAHAASGDWANGKRIYQTKGSKDKSCNDCHTKGETNGKKLKGKKIPNLREEVGAEPASKIEKKTRKHLDKDVGMQLSEKEFADLMSFVLALPDKGWDGQGR